MPTKPTKYNPQTKHTDTTTDFSGGINQSVSPSELKENELLEITI